MAAAKWLALRPGYSYRLQACDTLLQAGKVEEVTPLYQYIAYECHNESSHEAARKLLLLKEADRIHPFLAGSTHSDVAESRYQAYLGLAMANCPFPDQSDMLVPRWKLKTAIFEERMLAIEQAAAQFSEICSRTLQLLSSACNTHTNLLEIAELGLNLMPSRQIQHIDVTRIGRLLGSEIEPVARLNAAIFALGTGNLESAYDTLVDMVRSTTSLSLPIHCKSLQLIALVVNPKTVEMMLQALENEKADIRRIAAQTLGTHGDLKAVKPLQTKLNDKDLNTRRYALNSLGSLGAIGCIPQITDIMLTDEDETIRRAAAAALSQFEEPNTFEALKIAQNDPHYSVRSSAVLALASLKLSECIPLILNRLRDEHDQVRRQSAMALSRFELEDQSLFAIVQHLLIALAQDELPTIRWMTAQSLGIIGDTNAVKPLLDLLIEKDEIVLRGILFALNRFYYTQEVKEYIDTAYSSHRYQSSLGMLLLLYLLGHLSFSDELIELLCNDKSEIRDLIGYAMLVSEEGASPSLLLACLSDEEPLVRQGALEILSQHTSAKQQQYLLYLLNDEDVNLSDQILRTLAKTSTPAFYDSLLNAWAINATANRESIFDIITDLRLTEYAPFCEAFAIAAAPYEATRTIRSLIHLQSPSVFSLIDRFEKQFPKSVAFTYLKGQAHWQAGHLDLAISSFHDALEQKETVDNYLAIAHFYIEHQDLASAQKYLDHAWTITRNYREECLFTQAVIYWLTNHQELSKEYFSRTHLRSRTQQNYAMLAQYDFWRESALTALKEIHEHYVQVNSSNSIIIKD